MQEVASVTVQIDSKLHGMRADKALATVYPEVSRSRWQDAFEAAEVWINGAAIEKRRILQAGEQLTCNLPVPHSSETFIPEPFSMELQVLHEDDSLIAINKPAGIVTHPGHGNWHGTLVEAILHHTNGKLAIQDDPTRPGVVHRLDKATTGVILFAKTGRCRHRLCEWFAHRKVHKEYLALVQGVPGPESGQIDQPIRRHPTKRILMQAHPEGRKARTDWKRENSWAGASRLRCRIHTGRTHQIRVHMASIGHPLLGDVDYGYRYRETEPELARSRVFLHAEYLRLPNPESPEYTLELQAPVPQDFKTLTQMLDAAQEQ